MSAAGKGVPAKGLLEADAQASDVLEVPAPPAQVPPPPAPLPGRIKGSDNPRLNYGSKHLNTVVLLRKPNCQPTDCPCGDAEDLDGLALDDFERDGLAGTDEADGESDSASTPAKTGMLAYAEMAIQRVKAKREHQLAKENRKLAVRKLHAYQARRRSMRDCKDETVKSHALAKITPLEALPELPKIDSARLAVSAWLGKISSTGPAECHVDATKIDFHQHCMHGDEDGLQLLMDANRAWGVRHAVLLSLRFPRDTRKEVQRRNDWILGCGEKHDMFVPFVTVIEDDPDAADMFKDCLGRGAKGLKLIGWHSNYIKEFDYDLRLPSLLEVFRLAESWEVPVLVHLWLGYSKTKRNYIEDLDIILTEMPRLKFVLAHFGLGFDPETLPLMMGLVAKHRNLYFDTSLYGSFCEVWFNRASNQAQPLRDLVCRFPRQVLFGSDIFGCRAKQPKEYNDGLKASVSFVTQEALACMEFRRTDYFRTQVRDKYGLVAFDPQRLHGLQLGDDAKLLERVFSQNAMDILKLS